jgi:hypothetical protein
MIVGWAHHVEPHKAGEAADVVCIRFSSWFGSSRPPEASKGRGCLRPALNPNRSARPQVSTSVCGPVFTCVDNLGPHWQSASCPSGVVLREHKMGRPVAVGVDFLSAVSGRSLGLGPARPGFVLAVWPTTSARPLRDGWNGGAATSPSRLPSSPPRGRRHHCPLPRRQSPDVGGVRCLGIRR